MRLSYLGSVSLCAGLLGILVLSGCKVYDASLVEGLCNSVDVPARPTQDDSTDAGEITFALYQVVLEQGPEWTEIGYNLDGYCTDTIDSPSDCMPPDSEMPELDGSGGIDNAFGSRLFPTVSLVLPDFEEDAQAAQAAGNGALIVRVSGWNGEDNDPQLRAVISQTIDGTPGNPDGSQPDVTFNGDFQLVDGAGDLAPPPAWDGNDYFWVRDDTFQDSDPERPLIVDDNAYLSNRVAVLHLNDRIEIAFFAGDLSATVRMSDARATGVLTADNTALENVTISGRWSINDLVDTASDLGVCTGTIEFDLLLAQINRIADVRSRAGTGGPNVTCDAVSVGTRFNGVQAKWAEIAPSPPIPNPCE